MPRLLGAVTLRRGQWGWKVRASCWTVLSGVGRFNVARGGGYLARRLPAPIVWRPRATVEESGLVREHDRLDTVAEVQLLEDVRDVCLDRRVAYVELSANLNVREAAGDQAKHVELALGQTVEPRRRRGLWNAHELFDHAFRDGRGEKRISAGNRADCREELFGRVILEHEAAGAGAQRLVDIFVEVERRQDQDPRGGVGLKDSPRRLEA